MVKKLHFHFLLLVLALNTSHFLSAQEAKKSKKLPEIEQVYLHTDRDTYTVGEDLWYKAYSVYGFNNMLFDHSKLLYVELISPEAKVVCRNITKLDNGLGHGDFKLIDSLGISKEGNYKLRAYTNWMKNFDDEFMFVKDIKIVNLENRDGLIVQERRQEDISQEDKTEIKSSLKADFFPEGGSLIEGVQGTVAFKITNDYGKPVNALIEIVNAQGKPVGSAKSVLDGMGKFNIIPRPNESYKAIIKAGGEELTKSLPKIEKLGYSFNVKKSKGKQFIIVRTNDATLKARNNEPVTIIGTLKGITYFEGTQSLGQTTITFVLPEENFPAGIAQFTLYDSASKPHCERLVFIDKSDEIDVSVNTNKETYSEKEKVEVSVVAKTSEGVPVKASMSLAAIDGNIVPLEGVKQRMSISSYFLMESDLKGHIRNPGQYFDNSDPSRFNKLDLLLLTHGWRNFLWKTIPEPKKEKRFRVEKGFEVSGYVTSPKTNGPLQNAQINMLLLNKGKSAFLVNKTDAKGRFQFDDLAFFGEATMMINSKNEKGKNKGRFILSQTLSDTLNVVYDSEPATFTKQLTSFKDDVVKKYMLNNIPLENQLDEVVIEATKKPERVKMYASDNSYKVDTSKRSFPSIHQVIQYYVPGVIISGDNISFAGFRGAALLMVDEVEVDAGFLSAVTPDDVESIDYIKSAKTAFFGTRGGNGVILIYTKEGGGTYRPSRNKTHSVVNSLKGFYDARVFYAPSYDGAEDPALEADARNTLCWEPYVHPDETGNAKVVFYNSEIKNTQVNITLEGLTEKGIPIVVRKSYYVEN